MKNAEKQRSGWLWVPTLYYAEGLPYILVYLVSGVMYKRLGVSNTEIALYTSWFYLPWVIKPFWSPIVDLLKTKRYWILVTQFFIGTTLGAVALAIPLSSFMKITILLFWLVAFTSATHDIAADGFYMLGLSEHRQAYFVGIRNTFYRLAMITGQGLLLIFAGYLENEFQLLENGIALAWSISFGTLAVLFILFVLYHVFILPKPASDQVRPNIDIKALAKEFYTTFALFFKKEKIHFIILFLLLYRFGEAQLLKIASLFLLDVKSAGGLALATEQVGFAYGTLGMILLIIGGILGGFLAARSGLHYWMWWLALAMNLPNAVYIYLSFYQPENFSIITICIAIEQFGYGLGFTVYALYMIYVARGAYKTAHYAIATGFMALGMMLPGMFSGWLQESVGYRLFFIWVLLATLPGFILLKYIPLDTAFGKKE
jgi:PAT family beta-lactamase induction signal transducer AmpG